MRKYLVIYTLLIGNVVMAQRDTIYLQKDDMLVGEVKTLSAGILTMETYYSDQDFQVEFNKVTGFAINRKCFVFLSNGSTRYGNIRTNQEGSVVLTTNDKEVEYYKISEVVGLEEVSDDFWSRVEGSIDLGYNFTKANSNSQLTSSGAVSYLGSNWRVEGNITVLNSQQEETERTKRTNTTLRVTRTLAKKWFLIGDASFLANTEQALDGRINPSLGLGRYLVHTNKLYLGLSIGLTYNFENYVESSLNKTSGETVVRASFNMFDFDDIDLITSVQLYPSITERGRIRTDYDITLKYDLPLDFYIKTSYTLNFDNQPAVEGNDLDYIFTSGFGWEFN